MIKQRLEVELGAEYIINIKTEGSKGLLVLEPQTLDSVFGYNQFEKRELVLSFGDLETVMKYRDKLSELVRVLIDSKDGFNYYKEDSDEVEIEEIDVTESLVPYQRAICFINPFNPHLEGNTKSNKKSLNSLFEEIEKCLGQSLDKRFIEDVLNDSNFLCSYQLIEGEFYLSTTTKTLFKKIKGGLSVLNCGNKVFLSDNEAYMNFNEDFYHVR